MYLRGHYSKIWKWSKNFKSTIDNQLKFDSHVKLLCKTVSYKLNCLARVAKFLCQRQKLLLFNSFIQGQFNYCPLVWMFCGRKAHSRINNIHEPSLRLIFNDYNSSFNQLLTINKDVTTHNKCLQILCTEVYKIVNGSATTIMNDTKFE